MKIVTLIEDGFGRLHLLATPAPDLVRREYVAATGNAKLLWCGVAPTYLGGKAIVEEVCSWFQHDPVEGLQAGSHEVIRALEYVTVILPRLRPIMRRVKHSWRRIRKLVRKAIRSTFSTSAA